MTTASIARVPAPMPTITDGTDTASRQDDAHRTRAYFARLRSREFPLLDKRGETYLDYTGSALPFASHVAWHAELLHSSVFGNPHSENPASRASSEWAHNARAAILEFLDADAANYEVVLTANASAAIKLVAESFPFQRHSRVLLATDNHNSVLGIREYARAAGATVTYLPLDDELRLCDTSQVLCAPLAHVNNNLLAFPAQSNFSGVRHPLLLVHLAQSLGYRVLLDAAAFVPTARLSLREIPADFVTLSLYKVMGYPTGVGALVAHRDALAALRRPWFAGGTIEFASVQSDLHLLRRGAEGFEDGTPNFLALSAISRGLAMAVDVGYERIGAHIQDLTARLIEGLVALRHTNGNPLAIIHGPIDGVGRGGTVAFNLADRRLRWIDHTAVEKRLGALGVSVRSGCFCNPGAAERAFGFDAEQVARCVGKVTQRGGGTPFSIPRFGACMRGRPVGAVRASVGLATNEEDIARFLTAIATFRR